MANLLPGLSAPDLHWIEPNYDFSIFHYDTQRRIRQLFHLHNVQVKQLNTQLIDQRELVAHKKEIITQKDNNIAESLYNTHFKHQIEELALNAKGWKDIAERSLDNAHLKCQVEELALSAKHSQDAAEAKDIMNQLLLDEMKRKDEMIAKLQSDASRPNKSIENAVAEVKALKAQVQDLPTTLTRKTDPTNDGDASPDTTIALSIAENEVERLENRVSSLQEDIAEVEMVHGTVVEDLKQTISELEEAARDTKERHAVEVAALRNQISDQWAKWEEGEKCVHAATALLQEQHNEEKTALKVRITQLEAELGASTNDREAAVVQRKQAYEHFAEVKERTHSVRTQIDMLEQEKTSRQATQGDEEYALSGSVQSTSNEVRPWQLDTEDLRQWVRDGKKSWLQQRKRESSDTAERANGDEGRGPSEACSVSCDFGGGEKETEQPLLDLDPEEHEACGWPVLAADNDAQATEYWCGSAVARFSTSGIEDQQSFQSGLAVGTYKGRIEGRMAGHQAGIEEGFLGGFERGRAEGYKAGQQHGTQQEETRRMEATRIAFADGEVAGFKDGFTRGLAQGLQSTIEETQEKLNVVMQEVDAKRITEV